VKYHPIYLLITFFALILLADIIKPRIIQDLVTGKNYSEYTCEGRYKEYLLK